MKVALKRHLQEELYALLMHQIDKLETDLANVIELDNFMGLFVIKMK